MKAFLSFEIHLANSFCSAWSVSTLARIAVLLLVGEVALSLGVGGRERYLLLRCVPNQGGNHIYSPFFAWFPVICCCWIYYSELGEEVKGFLKGI